MRAFRPEALSAVHPGSSRDSDKVIARGQSEAVGIGHLHDGALECAALVLLGEAYLITWQWYGSAIHVDRDPHQRSIELLPVGVGRRHDADLQRVQDDAGADRVNTNQVDESLDHDSVI